MVAVSLAASPRVQTNGDSRSRSNPTDPRMGGKKYICKYGIAPFCLHRAMPGQTDNRACGQEGRAEHAMFTGPLATTYRLSSSAQQSKWHPIGGPLLFQKQIGK